MRPKQHYDVVISFAGEDRKCAEALAEALKRRGVTVFYDRYEKAKLWGKDLYTHLSDVYQNQAQYCIMFLSQHYAKKLWTNREREAAQARAFQERKEYILPVRLDDTEIPGILPTIGYLTWPPENPETLAEAISEKLGKAPLPVFAASSQAPIIALSPMTNAKLNMIDEASNQKDSNAILSDPSLSVEDKVTLMIRLTISKLDQDIERQTQYVNSIQQETDHSQIDIETERLKRMVGKRDQMFQMLRQIIDKYNQKAKAIIDSMDSNNV